MTPTLPTQRLPEERPTPQLRRAAVAAGLTVLAVLITLWAVRRLADLLVLVVFSLFCSFAIEPGVNRLARRGWRRGAAALTVYAVLLAAVAAFLALLGNVVVQQVTDLVRALPAYTREVAVLLEQQIGVDLSPDDIARTAGSAGELTSSVLGGVLGLGATVFGLLFSLLTVLTLTFYFAVDGPRLRRAVCSLLPATRQRQVLRAWELAIDRTAAFVWLRAALATLSALVHALAFSLLDVPFAVSLGIWVGVVSQFVPTVGTYIAGAVPLAIALADDPGRALIVLGLIVVYQQLENYVITPPLASRALKVHPAVGFLAAVAGVALVGPLGALLALPVAATVQAFLSEYVVRHDVVDDPPVDASGGAP